MSRGNPTARMAVVVALSTFGMAAHTAREFGYAGLLDPGTGAIPFTAVQAALLLAWSRVPSRRTAAALAATGALQLVGGAIFSVLPLPFLPFAPEQTLDHYLSHALLGLAQLPLIVVPRRLLAGERLKPGSPEPLGSRLPPDQPIPPAR